MDLYPVQILPDDWDAFVNTQQQSQLPDCLQAFYSFPLPAMDQQVKDVDFVAVDIETTGLDAQNDDIISVGIVPFDSKRIYLSKAQHWLIRTRRLTSDSVIVHHITHSEVADAPALRSVLPQIIECLAGKQIVVHYRYMEREFFRQVAATLFEKNWIFPVIDTLELEAHRIQQGQPLLAKLLQKPLPSVRLPNVRKRYHLPAYKNHNALVDALATAELWQAQISHWDIEETDVRQWWC